MEEAKHSTMLNCAKINVEIDNNYTVMDCEDIKIETDDSKMLDYKDITMKIGNFASGFPSMEPDKNYETNMDIKESKFSLEQSVKRDFHDEDIVPKQVNTPDIAVSPTRERKCEFCHYKTTDLSEMSEHTKKHILQNIKYLKCEKCDYKCVYRSDMAKHYRKHTGEKAATCQICGFRCTKGSYLQRHIRHTHSDELPLKCEFCDFKCTTKRQLDSHSKFHLPDGMLKCMECDFKCAAILEFMRHRNCQHISKKYSCNSCEFQTNWLYSLSHHTKTKHGDDKPFKCDLCEFRSALKARVRQHERIHKSKEKNTDTVPWWRTDVTTDGATDRWIDGSGAQVKLEPLGSDEEVYDSSVFVKVEMLETHDLNAPPENVFGLSTPIAIKQEQNEIRFNNQFKYICENCNRRFKSKDVLERHMSTHQFVDATVAYSICPICQYQCTTKYSLEKHLKLHDETKKFECQYCFYRFRTNFSLNCHLTKHTGKKPIHCTLCPYSCTTKKDLVQHTRTHTGEKPFACKQCDYRCSITANLKYHIMTAHTGEKPYKCSVCSYKCTTNVLLQIHLRTHTGERPYGCTECSSRFSRKDHLTRHIKKHLNIDQKNIKCELCDYKCADSSTLRKHIRSHTGEKPYVCNFCDYKAVSSSHMKRHLKIHTRESYVITRNEINDEKMIHDKKECNGLVVKDECKLITNISNNLVSNIKEP